MIHSREDTICAQATPPGSGGVGILRISGDAAFVVADAVLRHNKPCRLHAGHTLHRASVIDPATVEPIDDVLVAVFHAPRSYTGNDVVEISCHGGPIPMRRTLQALLAAGARMAEPGEFTFRAYMNGKLDLAQAEAVGDIIAARTDEAHHAAQSQHRGVLSNALLAIRDIFLGVLARIEASIDFSDDVGDLDFDICRAELARADAAITHLLDSAARGMLYRDGASVVLLGRPNVGKSSLMNALLRTQRAIVTPIPGTTRDAIEETLVVKGIPMRLIDTAGLRETSDIVEQLGVARSHAAARDADVALIVIDAANPFTAGDARAIESAHERVRLVVANKIDAAPNRAAPQGSIGVSALTGEGIEALEEAIADRLLAGSAPAIDEAVVTKARHKEALLGARSSVANAMATIDAAMPPDFLAIDVRGAIDAIEQITGATSADDVINEIFSRFCIGK